MRHVARETDVHVGVCSHGAPCCPHNVVGTIVGGSAAVTVDGLAAARLGDLVEHDCPHCGTGFVSAACGAVQVDDLPTARLGDEVTYPGGKETVTTGSGTTTCC